MNVLDLSKLTETERLEIATLLIKAGYTVFEGATIKVWFNTLSTSRNFYNVAEMVQEGNAVLIKTGNGDQHLLNWDNINLIEEILVVDMNRKNI